MISLEEYFSGGSREKFGQKLSHPDATPERQQRAVTLLDRVNRLLLWAVEGGIIQANQHDEDTGCCISGTKNGAGDGGFRLQGSGTGSPRSKHKEGAAVDVYDPGDKLDNALTDDILKEYGLFREHPSATPGWCHLQILPPGSWSADNDRRTFYP